MIVDIHVRMLFGSIVSRSESNGNDAWGGRRAGLNKVCLAMVRFRPRAVSGLVVHGDSSPVTLRLTRSRVGSVQHLWVILG